MGNNPYSGKSSLIPSNRAARITTLVPFQCIRQQVRSCTDTEIIRSKRTEHQAATHIETVQVTTDIHCCHRHLLGIKVITGRTVNIPTAA